MKKTVSGIALVIWIVLFIISLPTLVTIGEVTLLNATQLTQLDVRGNTLIMNNEINSKTPEQFREVFTKYPEIDTIIMKEVPGSLDDTANLEIASWIAKKWLTIKLEKDSFIASGGTDFFLAGKNRIIQDGAQIWVHAWAGGSKTAKDFPVGHEYHIPYIDYYTAIGWPKDQAEAFYYFTINAAPASDMHIMTKEELEKYNIATEFIQ